MQRDRPALNLGRKAYDTIAREPNADEWMLLCLRAWTELGSDRPQGFSGAGPIPWSSVVRWCELNGLDRDDTQLTIDVLRILDNQRAERMAKS